MERYQKKNMQTLQNHFILNTHISLNIQNFMIFLQATFQTVVRLMWRNQEMRITLWYCIYLFSGYPDVRYGAKAWYH